jgi:hypothetical protein
MRNWPTRRANLPVNPINMCQKPDMRARIRLFGLIDQNASESWLDTCGWLISFQRSVSEAIRPVNQDGG